jgi:hypothetical protein
VGTVRYGQRLTDRDAAHRDQRGQGGADVRDGERDVHRAYIPRAGPERFGVRWTDVLHQLDQPLAVGQDGVPGMCARPAGQGRREIAGELECAGQVEAQDVAPEPDGLVEAADRDAGVIDAENSGGHRPTPSQPGWRR